VRCTPHGNIELVPQKQVFDFKPAPRPEQVGDKPHKQMKERKHHANDALILPHYANPPG
jgi:hypothetical protein